MNKVALVLGGISLGLLAAACSGSAESTPFPEAPADNSVATRLAELTGARWETDVDANGHPALFYALDDGHPVLPNAKDPKEVLGFLEPVRDNLGFARSFAEELDGGVVATEAAEDRLATMSFAQHVPGTKVPVFDGSLTAGVRADGSLAFVNAHVARHLDQIRPVPAFDMDAARAKLKALPGVTLIEGNEPMLGVSSPDPDAPVLVYRTMVAGPDGGHQIDLDAQTGAVVADMPLTSSGTVNAFGAEERYLDSDPKKRADARYPVEADTTWGYTVLGGNGPIGRITMLSYGTGLPLPVFGTDEGNGTYRFDYNPTPDSAVAGSTEQTAVNAFYNVSRSARYFKQAFDLSAWADTRTEIQVHRNTTTTPNGTVIPNRGNAVFDPSNSSIRIGDGIMNSDETAWSIQSPATNVEFIAHEYSHGVIFAITSGRTRGQGLVPLYFKGEAGAINEGVSDILAAYAQENITQNSSGLFSFAEGLRSDNKPYRHFLHPSWGIDGGAVHYSTKRSVTEERDQGNTHFNSTIVSQAWALMAYGGYNDYSHLGVTAEIGFERAKWLFWNSLHAIHGESTLRMFADAMITYQVGLQPGYPTRTDLSPYWIKHSIVCAWTAVGVISPEHALALHRVTCPSSLAVKASCAGKVNGTYCDPNPKLDYASYTCKNGSIVKGKQCVTGQFCHRTSGSFDSFAKTDANGEAQCFTEPQSD